MSDFRWTTLRFSFPVMISFGDYHEIEEMKDFLSTLFDQNLECFELGEGDIEEQKEHGVDLLKHTGDFYVGLFQPKMPPEMYRYPSWEETWGNK